MRKYLFVLFLCFSLILFTGCGKKQNNNDDNKNNDPPVKKTEKELIEELLYDEDFTEDFRVYFNKMDGSDYSLDPKIVHIGGKVTAPVDPTRQGYVFKGWCSDYECTTPYDFKSQIVESIMLYAAWEDYTGVDYSYLLDEYVPSRISHDVTFPSTHEEDGKSLTLSFASSDEITLTNLGRVNPDRTETKVIVTMTVYTNDYATSYDKEVIIEPVSFAELRPGRIIFGYYSYWNFNGYTDSIKKIDAVNASFARVNSDFSLDLSGLKPYFNSFMSCRQNGVRVNLTVQGAEANSGNFSAAASTEEGRKTLANNIAEAVVKYHYDGVDIDWEFPGWFYQEAGREKDYEAENFTLLMKEIYTTLKAINPDYTVSAALPGGSEGYKRFNLAEAQKYLDYINLMTYDMEASSKVQHHTALFSQDGKATMHMGGINTSVEIFHLRGVPYEKILPGIAFYGKMTTTETSTNGGLAGNSTSSKYTTITFTNIYNKYLTKVDGKNIIEYWDSNCFANYLYLADTKTFITYDSVKSITYKCKYVRNLSYKELEAPGFELGGVMIWELGEDTTGVLINAVLDGMSRNY